mmetsp:Transcript_24332/g.72500  ORF Transcript_24332/g.72500 Transcript_24332/m.72500 type:complete len:99 (-) Transcript_24332:594-890(-)
MGRCLPASASASATSPPEAFPATIRQKVIANPIRWGMNVTTKTIQELESPTTPHRKTVEALASLLKCAQPANSAAAQMAALPTEATNAEAALAFKAPS